MDLITTALVAALTAGSISGLTDVTKMAITDAYQGIKALLTIKFGAKSPTTISRVISITCIDEGKWCEHRSD
jgi:hypothetical protein